MKQTEQALSRIFAICDDVAKTGETIRTENEGEEFARVFLGSAEVSRGDGSASQPHQKS